MLDRVFRTVRVKGERKMAGLSSNIVYHIVQKIATSFTEFTVCSYKFRVNQSTRDSHGLYRSRLKWLLRKGKQLNRHDAPRLTLEHAQPRPLPPLTICTLLVPTLRSKSEGISSSSYSRFSRLLSEILFTISEKQMLIMAPIQTIYPVIAIKPSM